MFVVHGHDEVVRLEVEKLLKSLKLNPVILQDQTNQGLTIIEKFEKESDVEYAVVICTPDDVGASNAERDNLNPRARQNVLLEWGYFLARLGRSRVTALVQEQVELPSDYKGVIYTKLDGGNGWKYEIADELQAAGIEADKNLI